MKFIFFVLLNVTLYASTQEALDAYKNHEYKIAFSLYQKEAKKGDTTAQNALSYLYFNGIGVAKNNAKALEWLQKAAKSGDARAAFDLGMLYLRGENIPKDLKKAASWLEIAANKDNKEAQYNLALMYYHGDGVKQDIKKSAELLDKAARNGYPAAKANVGRVYMQLLDFKKAKYWLSKNVKDGDAQAADLLKEIEAAHKD